MIPRVLLSPSGPSLSRLVYGTWRVLRDTATATPEHLLQRLHKCLDLGITSVDTAEIYGLYRVEELVGQALRLAPGLRSRMEIITKAGIYVPCDLHPERKTAFYDTTAERLVKSAEKSLRFLGTDHIDLFLVHRHDWLTSIEETAAGLNKLIKDGKILGAGVSNYNVHQLQALSSRLDQPLATNQIELHLLYTAPLEDGRLDQAQRLRFRPMAWSPLAGGRLLDPANEAARRVHAACAAISAKYGDATVDQLAFAWIMAHPSAPLPILGTNRLDRLETSARSAAIQMDREDWYALWTAAKGHGIP